MERDRLQGEVKRDVKPLLGLIERQPASRMLVGHGVTRCQCTWSRWVLMNQ